MVDFIYLPRVFSRTQFEPWPAPSFFALGGMNPFHHRNAVKQLEGFTSDVFKLMQDEMTGPNTAKSGFIYRYNDSQSYNFTIKAGLKAH